jgi:hypothetical protein
MTVLIQRSLLLFIVLFASAKISLAAPPSGFVGFSFDTNSPVYDLTGSLQFDQTMSGAGDTETPLSYGINVTQDARGFITGSGVIVVAVGNDFVAAEYTAKGKISSQEGVTRVTLNVKLKGEDAFGGIVTDFRVTIEYSLTLNPETGALEGTARGSGKFGPLGSTKIRSDVSVGMSPGTDGSWVLQMNIVAFDKLSGTAVVVLSNGRTLNFTLKGNFDSSTQSSTIKLTGTGDSRGNSAKVIFDDFELLLLEGKLLGQQVSL